MYDSTTQHSPRPKDQIYPLCALSHIYVIVRAVPPFTDDWIEFPTPSFCRPLLDCPTFVSFDRQEIGI